MKTILTGQTPGKNSETAEPVLLSTLADVVATSDWRSPLEVIWGSEKHFVGRKTWAIPNGYIPTESTGPAPALTSHEACSILNASPQDAQIEITIFFEDRDPAGPYHFPVAAHRTRHLRFNDFKHPERIPRDTPYASLIQSNVPIVVQYTRLDSRQPANALLSTIAFPVD